jgi:hypothetical protein
MKIIWDQISSDFEMDGSLRDIYFLNATKTHWQKFLTAAKESNFDWHLKDRRLDTSVEMDIPKVINEIGSGQYHLMLEKDGVNIVCHFFTESEIEVDITPTEVNDQKSLDVVLEFMEYFSKEVGLSCQLTFESQSDKVIFKYDGGFSFP